MFGILSPEHETGDSILSSFCGSRTVCKKQVVPTNPVYCPQNYSSSRRAAAISRLHQLLSEESYGACRRSESNIRNKWSSGPRNSDSRLAAQLWRGEDVAIFQVVGRARTTPFNSLRRLRRVMRVAPSCVLIWFHLTPGLISEYWEQMLSDPAFVPGGGSIRRATGAIFATPRSRHDLPASRGNGAVGNRDGGEQVVAIQTGRGVRERLARALGRYGYGMSVKTTSRLSGGKHQYLAWLPT